MHMRGRRQGPEHADKQQYAKTKTDFGKAVALERAQCRQAAAAAASGRKRFTVAMATIAANRPILKRNQPPVIGRHKVARTAQQIPAVDETACEYSPDAEDTDNGKAAGHSNCEIVPSRL